MEPQHLTPRRPHMCPSSIENGEGQVQHAQLLWNVERLVLHRPIPGCFSEKQVSKMAIGMPGLDS